MRKKERARETTDNKKKPVRGRPVLSSTIVHRVDDWKSSLIPKIVINKREIYIREEIYKRNLTSLCLFTL